MDNNTDKPINIDTISPDEKIKLCQSILDNHSYRKIKFTLPNGKKRTQILDVVTAQAVLNVYDNIKSESQIKYKSKHLLVMIDMAWRLAK
jgi:hypothetical protein